MWGVGLERPTTDDDATRIRLTFTLITGLTTAFRSGIMVIGSGYAKSKSTDKTSDCRGQSHCVVCEVRSALGATTEDEIVSEAEQRNAFSSVLLFRLHPHRYFH